MYHLGCHPGSRVTVNVKRKRIVLGIRPAVFVGGTREVKVWRKNLEGQRKRHWSWWASWNFSGSPATRSVPHRGSLGRGPGHGPGTQLGTTRNWTLSLENSMGICSIHLLWSVHHLVCLQRAIAVSHLTASLML